MSRPPQFPVEVKIRIVLSALAGEVTVTDAARKYKTSEAPVASGRLSSWRAGRLVWLPVVRDGRPRARRVSRRRSRNSRPRAHRAAGVEEVRGAADPFEDLEVTRSEAQVPVSRFCELIDKFQHAQGPAS